VDWGRELDFRAESVVAVYDYEVCAKCKLASNVPVALCSAENNATSMEVDYTLVLTGFRTDRLMEEARLGLSQCVILRTSQFEIYDIILLKEWSPVVVPRMHRGHPTTQQDNPVLYTWKTSDKLFSLLAGRVPFTLKFIRIL